MLLIQTWSHKQIGEQQEGDNIIEVLKQME